MPKLAVVGPNFFSYMNAICEEFKRVGLSSEYFDERHSNTILSKILYRLNLSWIINRKKRNHLRGLIDSISKGGFTDVLLIDVEVIDKVFVETIKSYGIRIHIYMWDSANNKSGFKDYLGKVTSKGTFDLSDSKELNMNYIPLFAMGEYSQKRHNNLPRDRDIDISFCGTLHSDRAYHLHKLNLIAKNEGMNLVLMIFFHSKILLAVKCIRNFSNFFFLREVSNEGFSKEAVAESMFRSKFVLDMQHSGQGGLTARTFEALRSGAGLITFNSNVYTMPESFHDRIFLIKDINDIKKLKLTEYKNVDFLTNEQDYYLSLTRFVNEILNMMDVRL